MGEHRTDEPKIPAARRGARPFVGPAGAASAGRGLLRPVPSGNRPGSAPFAPPTAPERGTLGTGRPVQPAAPAPISPSAANESTIAASVDALPAVVPGRPSTPTSPFDISLGTESHAIAPSRSIDEPPGPAIDSTDGVASVAPDAGEAMDMYAPLTAADPVGSTEPAPSPNAETERPVTSDMVAIDAFDAFDAVWGPPDAMETPPAQAQAASTPPLDESSLGTGVDAQHLWADEITLVPENVRSATPPMSHQVDANVVETEWTSAVSSDAGIPAWLADDSSAAPVVASAQDIIDAEAHADAIAAIPPVAEIPDIPVVDASPVVDAPWPDPLLAEYAPYIPTPSSIEAIAPHRDPVFAIEPAAEAEPVQAVAGPVLEPNASIEVGSNPEPVSEGVLSKPAVPDHTHGMRVSAALDRLAERVRSGDIDVSSVAPEAPDAAVLASVLAALLGGSSSR